MIARRRLLAGFAAFLALPFATPAAAQLSGPAFLQSFSTPDAASQVYLTAMTISGQHTLPGAPDEEFDIYQFNGTSLVGSSLWNESLATDGSLISFTPNLELDPNALYALAMTNPYEGASAPDFYAGGSAYVTQGGGTYQPLVFSGVAHDWLAFSTTFGDAPVTATPEPASLALLATGLVGIAGMGRRRKKLVDTHA